MTSGKQIHHEVQPKERTSLEWWLRPSALCVCLAATAITLPAQTLTTLVSFEGVDGWTPYAGVVQGEDGNLYGTAEYGGANKYGTVFKMTPTGTLTTLYSFCAQTNCTDGARPVAGLVLATDGNFYGTTLSGGNGGAYGYGTVFKITPAGTLKTLYSFCSPANCIDGANPTVGLVQAVDGNLYGTASAGGAYGYGTVFKITGGGTLTTLYSFCSLTDCVDGYNSGAPLVQASDGNLYGTTEVGGANNNSGTVFKITTGGTLTTLYSFCSLTGCVDGEYPVAGLIQASDGNLYGTTSVGGTSAACIRACGTVFKITTTGTLTTLHSFGKTDGELPYAGLVQATDGNLYGSTLLGGTERGICGIRNCGTLFKITLSGTLTTLYNLCSKGGDACTDGAEPYAPMFQATGGNLLGTTLLGGTFGSAYGTIFSLSAGLGPFVETVPASGKVGTAVQILGTNLLGATSVSFNGTAATFTVNSTGTAISTRVPSGATTGTAKVVTPGGTLSSNEPFRVRQ